MVHHFRGTTASFGKTDGLHITLILHFLKRSQESGGKLHPFLHPFGLLSVICPISNTTRIPLNCAVFDVRYVQLDILNSGSNPVTSTKNRRKSKGFRLFFIFCIKRRLWRFFHATDGQRWVKGQRHYTAHKNNPDEAMVFSPSFRPDYRSTLCIGCFCVLRLINRNFRAYSMTPLFPFSDSIKSDIFGGILASVCARSGRISAAWISKPFHSRSRLGIFSDRFSFSPESAFLLYFGANAVCYLQFHFICARLLTPFGLPMPLFCVSSCGWQTAPFYTQKEFFPAYRFMLHRTPRPA